MQCAPSRAPPPPTPAGGIAGGVVLCCIIVVCVCWRKHRKPDPRDLLPQEPGRLRRAWGATKRAFGRLPCLRGRCGEDAEEHSRAPLAEAVAGNKAPSSDSDEERPHPPAKTRRASLEGAARQLSRDAGDRSVQRSQSLGRPREAPSIRASKTGGGGRGTDQDSMLTSPLKARRAACGGENACISLFQSRGEQR